MMNYIKRINQEVNMRLEEYWYFTSPAIEPEVVDIAEFLTFGEDSAEIHGMYKANELGKQVVVFKRIAVCNPGTKP